MAHILLTEDDEAVRAFVRRALEIDGHDVTLAEDGGAALEILQSGEKFDLLLSDIMMPVMDGIGLALNVARDYPTLPILLMTGFADQRERAHNLEAIIYDVVPKPFTLAEIRKAVREALAAGPRKPEA
ncbi:Mycobacterial persistence regulator A [Hartmannibacter diazotrophicus]|uniref:Mycobacterial persistence regulator A n=1 Tax=Hartmannibacter diazotrophicus TaxID=1482074 RepID=A0A2C9DC67_9HYPH|nr:response regulator [Hartmannibacter diazotrophicus]SON57914.1 Mycobacterial persistence regulator A [Hartmannibacter diazotrophicus]